MQIKIYNIPIPGGEQMTAEMNAFLRSKRILQTEHHIVTNAHGSFWCFCIKYLDGKGPVSKKKKIDYREELDEMSFRRFARMREIRKKLAADEGIPAYAIFTNDELARMAQIENLTSSAMQNIKGVGARKVEKYGGHFILKDEESE